MVLVQANDGSIHSGVPTQPEITRKQRAGGVKQAGPQQVPQPSYEYSLP